MEQFPFRLGFSYLESFYDSIKFEKLEYNKNLCYGLDIKTLLKFKNFSSKKLLMNNYLSLMNNFIEKINDNNLNFITFETDFNSFFDDNNPDEVLNRFITSNPYPLMLSALKKILNEYGILFNKKLKKIIVIHDKDSNKHNIYFNDFTIFIKYYIKIHYCSITEYGFYESISKALFK
jgi:hypothetical protein